MAQETQFEVAYTVSAPCAWRVRNSYDYAFFNFLPLPLNSLPLFFRFFFPLAV